jgi:hypothetical protein
MDRRGKGVGKRTKGERDEERDIERKRNGQGTHKFKSREFHNNRGPSHKGAGSGVTDAGALLGTGCA